MLEEKLKNLPLNPGCYLMKNKDGLVIYVGKAKILKNRVKSYFTGSHNKKTALLVSEIADFSYVMTNSEQESLILEANLIKQYSPKYNIRLMDDKTYPYIEITSEKDPMLVVSRYKEVPKNAILFGPYPNATSAKETVKLLHKLYPLRRCNPIAPKPCIYYHIGQCLGPCCHNGEIDYKPNIESITRFLKGDNKDALKRLKMLMEKASEELSFEMAIEYRDMIEHVKTTTEKQVMRINDLKDRDFIAYTHNEDDIAIHILKMRQGRILDTHQSVFSYIGDIKENVLTYLVQHYQIELKPEELVVGETWENDDLETLLETKIYIPKKGDKKKLYNLALDNAKEDLLKHHLVYRVKDELKQEGMNQLSKIFEKEIQHIEVFDNAQLFGVAPISAMITYKNLKFDKNLYRKYHIKTAVEDDYQSFKEVIYRRYQRLLIENKTMPDLILVDGGIGQLNAALETLNNLGLNIPIGGLKKNNKHQLEALVIPNETIFLDKKSELFKLLLSLSEEIHRFAITFHKKTRTKQANLSVFDKIPGLGEKRKKALLQTFSGIDEIKNASIKQLTDIGIPEAVANNLKEVLK
ncbi:UvrABC system protein C (Excinuclease ABC subunit C) [Alteracholeplasma palmae J233]|uniref:UvrABC system protein C n=1 Tax=Alteracholeplasma palmae (strain ATCC 49389 / J233) TaxID=1318466 RepID=U4KKJ2_ALTPJ|nr:excinuclease ABC subunit UvrC [Alteracholeplasma palmae]CCV64264.1 UvrABC system protein C (Excinuclease ABC subunit C) [Alteracholeplasma palmae J233]